MTIAAFRRQMNTWSAAGVPFLFIVDFEMTKPWIARIEDLSPTEILYDFNGNTNSGNRGALAHSVYLRKSPPSFATYEKKFEEVMRHLQYGDSYLTNLTICTEIVMNATLRELFHLSTARYKLLFQDAFLVFSPEIFVQISDGVISSYPMKGTIDAARPGAREVILNDRKEFSEHVTIVDLIRNDLSRIATEVSVSRFRYLDEIRTLDKTLLQVSSEIVGKLSPRFVTHLGDAIIEILPAGSVSGAPKQKTLEIIAGAEQTERGYYTGVMGLFDGKNLDCGVMIRYIERQNNQYYYRSGGGITTQSIASLEYQEAVDKVYVPFA